MTAAHGVRRLWLGAPAIALALGMVSPRAGAQQDDPRARYDAFYRPRAFPLDRVPDGALQAALTRMQAQWPQTRTGRSAPSLSSFVSSQSWSALGPAPITVSASQNYAGRINSIAVHPTNSQIIYIGAASGGVWKTTNGGTSWTPLTDNECGLAMGSVALDPVNPQIVYAGTGEENFNLGGYQGCGVLVSADGGTTWTQRGGSIFVASSYSATISKMLVDKATAGSTSTTLVFAASVTGVYRSPDSGTTWTRVLSGTITDLIATPNAGELYAAVYGNGVFKSVDNGLTWSRLAGFPTSNVGRISLAVTAAAPVVLYATVANVSTAKLLGVWTSPDNGTTWNSVTATGASCNSQCWYDMYLAVDPTTPTTIYFGGFSFYKSTNSGATFTDVGGSIHVDHHALAFDPQTPTTIYSGNDGGIYRSLDAGVTWTHLNTNLNITQFYAGIGVNPVNASNILGGAQDNGTAEWTGAAAWTSVAGGDGGYSLYDRAGTTAYLTYASGSAAHGVGRRDPGNSFWSFKNSGINTGDRSQWILPTVMDPLNTNVLYYGTYRLYRSANRGDAWTAISPDLTSGGGGIATVAISPADTNTIYAGAGDGTVAITTNLGATWTSITNGLPLRAITRIVVDPLDPKTAWLTVSGYGSGHVFKTVNAGSSWTDISYNLPNAPVSGIVMQRGSREIDVATDIGVFALPLGTTSWTPLAASLPNVPVTDLVYDGARGRLIAGTYGRGVFSLGTSTAALRGNITNSGTLSALDAQAILAAVVGLPLPAGAVRYPNGDANCDGDVTAVDALLVLSKLVGLNTAATCVGTVR